MVVLNEPLSVPQCCERRNGTATLALTIVASILGLSVFMRTLGNSDTIMLTGLVGFRYLSLESCRFGFTEYTNYLANTSCIIHVYSPTTNNLFQYGYKLGRDV